MSRLALKTPGPAQSHSRVCNRLADWLEVSMWGWWFASAKSERYMFVWRCLECVQELGRAVKTQSGLLRRLPSCAVTWIKTEPFWCCGGKQDRRGLWCCCCACFWRHISLFTIILNRLPEHCINATHISDCISPISSSLSPALIFLALLMSFSLCSWRWKLCD